MKYTSIRLIFMLVLVFYFAPGKIVYSAPNDPSNGPAPQIVGGIEAARGSWDWQAEIWVGNQFQCGGSLINKNYVLTAAHCVYSVKDSPGQIRIYIGGIYLGVIEDDKEKSVVVSLVSIHPQYQHIPDYTSPHDIAVLYLRNPVYSNEYVHPISWIKNYQNNDLLKPGSQATIAGWGQTELSPSSNILKQADVRIVENSICKQMIYSGITADMICVERDNRMQNNGSPCFGDSGGPLIVQNATTGEWLLGGAFMGGRCGKYTIYIRVPSYDSWINSVAGQQRTLPRIGIITGTQTKNQLLVKEGGLSTGWTNEYDNVIDFQLNDNRIGILTNDHDRNGVLRIKEGGLSAGWIDVFSNVAKFQISGDRIGVLTRDGVLRVKENGLSEGWAELSRGVVDFQLEGSRIGILSDFNSASQSSTLYVKEGSLNAGWVNEYSGVTKFQLEGSRIGVLLTDKTLLVKEGALNAGWVNEYDRVTKFQLTGNRIGVLLTDKTLLVKEGALNAGWFNQYGGAVSDFQLEGNRIGVLLDNRTLLVKEGSLTANFVNEASGIEGFLLENKRIGALTNGRTLLVKEGSLSATWVNEFENVQKFLLMDSY